MNEERGVTAAYWCRHRNAAAASITFGPIAIGQAIGRWC
jgi:hypothetical protein